ncbi:MAG: S8 family serine peptidase, partial [Acidimicrobiia bacterium]|nr:S8 family serine peptidase [Acidimicrobiia bacterium]
MRPDRRRLTAGVGALCAAFVLALPAPAARAQLPTPVSTDDPGLSRQWGLQRIGAPTAWATATGDGIVIAVVDSGIDLAHPDLGTKVIGGADCVGHDDSPTGCVDGAASDDAGHGTHVAGIAAAVTDNGTGVAGVAPMARLLSVRVLSLPDRCTSGDQPDCDASGTEADVAEGVRWAADHGADVINLSLGSVTQEVIGPGHELTAALEYAWSVGAIPVVAGGNDTLPGSLVDVPAVIVAATDVNDQRADYSSGVGNVRWGIAAPGGLRDDSASCESDRPNGILSTWFRAGAAGQSSYACLSGTSMSAPFVSGALAVLRSVGFTPQEAVDRMLATADDLGPTGPDGQFGSGRLNLASALVGVQPTGQPVRALQDGAAVPVESTTTVSVPGAVESPPPTMALSPV